MAVVEAASMERRSGAGGIANLVAEVGEVIVLENRKTHSKRVLLAVLRQ